MKIFSPLLISVCLCLPTILVAQAPPKFNYQAVVRNSTGLVIDSQSVNIRISIRDLIPSGTILYRETHVVTTNNFGLVSIEVGGGTPVSGSFASINWGAGSKFMEVEMDATGGVAYAAVGVPQLLSVPYALYANQSTSGATGPSGPTGPTGVSGSSIGCGTTANSNYTIRGNGSGIWQCTDALQISSTGYVSINTTPSSFYNLRVNGNVGIGYSPNSSYELSVDGDGHFGDYVGIGTTPSSSYRLRVYGNTGIGSSVSSSYTLDVDGDTRIQDGLGIGTYPPSYGLYVGSSSNFYVPTSIGSSSGTQLVISSGEIYKLSSSIRYKENISDLKFDKSDFLGLRPVTYQYKKSCGGSAEFEVGFIAEEVEKIIPQLVNYEYEYIKDANGSPLLNEFGYNVREKTNRAESIKYEQICVYLFQIVAVQEKRINELEKAILQTNNDKK